MLRKFTHLFSKTELVYPLVILAVLGLASCTTYNPNTNSYNVNYAGTGLAVASTAAIVSTIDDDDYYYGGHHHHHDHHHDHHYNNRPNNRPSTRPSRPRGGGGHRGGGGGRRR